MGRFVLFPANVLPPSHHWALAVRAAWDAGPLLPQDLAQASLAFPRSQQRLGLWCDTREGSLAAHRAWGWGHSAPQIVGNRSPESS